MTRLAVREDAGYWRDRAEEARAMAGSFSNPATQAALHGIAETYDRLAEAVENRREMRPANSI